MNTVRPDSLPAWARLRHDAKRLHALGLRDVASGRAPGTRSWRIAAPGMEVDLGYQRLDDQAFAHLVELAGARGFSAWRQALFSGALVNSTEGRAAGHAWLRNAELAPPSWPEHIRSTTERFLDLAEQVRNRGHLAGGSQPIRRVVNLGIGGSDFGPRLLVDALGTGRDEIQVRFVANVDPRELELALRGAHAAETLFVIVSKSFDTVETLANAKAAREWLRASLRPGSAPERHFIAVTAAEDRARSFGVGEIFPMWPWVGGRFSVWSAVGFSAACALGRERFLEFLAGASEIDRHFLESPDDINAPLLLACIDVWNASFLGAEQRVVIPYSTALRLLPSYLQQLEMESNGKRVDHRGQSVGYATAPSVWGGEGTIAQHAYLQLLHQGTIRAPVDFIVVQPDGEPEERQRILLAHAAAQADALANGTDAPAGEPWKACPGGRPSTTIHLRELGARGLGRLLALHEHRVFCAGVLWNVNSFDQWGVDLGKRLAALRLGASSP